MDAYNFSRKDSHKGGKETSILSTRVLAYTFVRSFVVLKRSIFAQSQIENKLIKKIGYKLIFPSLSYQYLMDVC